ncbi:glycosyltransferase family 2 protein [Weissella soli]|uniref:glycosyltransferase family 2 protein n=1 Tax=Weissella soli TaxID=155866 RepID=UPI0011BBE7B0|nr:glycosyltransferase family 2 protein [Weissella soli]QEA35200.1 glycosyltransferase family 2 protein [Weissella soli]
MLPKVSVITPIYNGQVYAKELVNNLHKQSFESVEFIILDDGSSDGTLLELEEQVGFLNDPRFVIIQKKNTGVSDTRNVGISTSMGEYIIFMDSDDNIPECFVEKYYEKIKKNGTDIEFFPVNKTEEKNVTQITGTQFVFDNLYSGEILNSSQILKLIFDFSLPGYPFGYISRKELWNNSFFPKDIHFTEDLYALVDILTNNHVHGHINKEKYYNYVQRSSSIMHNAGEKEEIASDIVTDRIINLLILRNIDEDIIKQAINFSLGHYIVHSENAVIRGNVALFEKYKKSLWTKFMKSQMSLKARINKFVKIIVLFIPSTVILRKILIYKRILTKQEPIK